MHSYRLRRYKSVRGQSWRLKNYGQLGRIQHCRERGPADLADSSFQPQTLTCVILEAT